MERTVINPGQSINTAQLSERADSQPAEADYRNQPRIALTGASGQLGRRVIHHLLELGAAPESIVAVVRDRARADDLAELGLVVRQADYENTAAYAEALAGVDRVLLISSNAVGGRLRQHRNVVDAAVLAGVKLLGYTSIAHADSTTMKLATEHQATEQYIRDSWLPFVFLRNGWYLENYTATVGESAERGAIVGSAGNGRVSAASRDDFAAAAAVVLLSEGQDNVIYELGGDESFTQQELAAEISRQTGKPVQYQDLPALEYARVLEKAGVPTAFAGVVADSSAAVKRGELEVTSGDLSRLIGRPTTTLSAAVAAAL